MSRETRLAIEWSSRRLSVAASNGSDPLVVAYRECERFRAPEAMAVLEEVVQALPGGFDTVGEIWIGRGPGNYSGIRQAFALAAGMAAPGGIEVRAVSSGLAQAQAWQQSTQPSVWILGDARRGLWWGRCFPDSTDEWRLAPPEDWQDAVGDACCLSAEAERLQGLTGLVQAMPRAEDLLALSPDQVKEPCRPLYLHPAVGSGPSGAVDAPRA